MILSQKIQLLFLNYLLSDQLWTYGTRYICGESQAKNELLQENNTSMKTNIYVQHTWPSPKFFSQAKNENVNDHP